MRLIKSSISGQRLVDWLLEEKLVDSRKEGVAFGAHLMATGLLKHGNINLFLMIHPLTNIVLSVATDDQKFKDSGIYYQFVPDATSDQPLQHTDFNPIATFTCQTIMVS